MGEGEWMDVVGPWRQVGTEGTHIGRSRPSPTVAACQHATIPARYPNFEHSHSQFPQTVIQSPPPPPPQSEAVLNGMARESDKPIKKKMKWFYEKDVVENEPTRKMSP